MNWNHGGMVLWRAQAKCLRMKNSMGNFSRGWSSGSELFSGLLYSFSQLGVLGPKNSMQDHYCKCGLQVLCLVFHGTFDVLKYKKQHPICEMMYCWVLAISLCVSCVNLDKRLFYCKARSFYWKNCCGCWLVWLKNSDRR